MSREEPVSNWIRNIDSDSAVQKLWERYFRRLVGLAKKKLKEGPRAVLDEEDVALSAFESFCKNARRGKYPKLDDRNNLWSLLVLITARKACDAIQHERRKKRGGGAVLGEAALDGGSSSGTGRGLDQWIDEAPTPAFAAEVAERVQQLLAVLDEPLQRIALWKMEGYTNAEIADLLGCVEATVERRLRVIRSLWEDQV